MPTPALLLILATLLPLGSFVLLMFVGRRMGTPFAGIVATLAIAGSFVCSSAATFSWMEGAVDWGHGKGPIQSMYAWIPTGAGIAQEHKGFLDVGIYVDSVTIVMFAMITGVATLIHIFSIGYMRDDKRFARFFTYLGLFCFSMLGLVIAATTLQLFVFWELVGLCSYLLIGFWYEQKSASNAAIKAFICNRIGDVGFLIGFGILFHELGNVTLLKMWGLLGSAGAGGAIALPGGAVFSGGLLTIVGVALFFGAIGKSAQFPLHVWLPDAMEGPTSASALIHAATMVAAGVYLMARLFPILTPDAKLFIAIIGAVTLTMAALIATAQTDIKKILAYSTISQLGYMILAMGLGSWVGAIFHLVTHAFFKALLFLGAGSVIHAADHEQELREYGGLWRKIPMTALTFAVAVFAIAGTWGFSGYYSKDLILQHAAAYGHFAAGHGLSRAYWAFFILPTCVAYVTAFYMTRCWMLTFWGKPRNQQIYEDARESPMLWGPLVVLAIASVIGGRYLKVKDLIVAAETEIGNAVGRDDLFQTAWHVEIPPPLPTVGEAEVSDLSSDTRISPAESLPLRQGEYSVHKYGHFAWIVGIGFGFLIYLNGYWITRPLMKIRPLNWVRIWLYRRMYFDEFYYSVFVATTIAISRTCAALDKYVVDGIVTFAAWTMRQLSVAAGLSDRYIVDGAVDGVADLALSIGAAARAPQTGRIRMYVTVLMMAVTLGLAGAIFVMLSK